MLMTIELVLVALAIGMLVGAVGIGGILLPSALTLIAGLAIHQSMATSLTTFIFSGLAGTLAFQRRGSIAWRARSRSAPACAAGPGPGPARCWPLPRCR